MAKGEVGSHRFSENLIKPSGDEGKAIQDVARLQEAPIEARSFNSPP